jgi:hypothetical protein
MFKLFKRYFKIYPCKPGNCVVSIACSKPCDKLEFDDKKLLKKVMDEECCPDCGGKTFCEGPSGGLCVNIKCRDCKHEFNIALPMIFERIGTFCKENLT